MPPHPPTLEEKKEDLMVVPSTIDGGLLGRVWDELGYRIDVCRGTLGGGGFIVSVCKTKKKTVRVPLQVGSVNE